MKKVRLFGYEVYGGTMDALVRELVEAVGRRDSVCQASLNVAKLGLCRRSPAFAATMSEFNLVTADGMSIVLGAALCRARIQERIPGIDLMARLLDEAEQHGFSVFFLGAEASVLERAVAAIRSRHPRLKIAGTRDGFFAPSSEEEVATSIRSSGADLLFVGMGSPYKEEFLARRRDTLGVHFAMGVGGSFDVWAGLTHRAPLWIQRVGLEWLYRTLQEPRRLLPRYLRDNMVFVRLLAGEIWNRTYLRQGHA